MTASPPKNARIALIVWRILAWLTGTGLILLCAAIFYHYVLDESRRPLTIIGIIHGNLYMVYLVCTLVLAERRRWRPVKALIVALAGTIPFVSFVAERKVTREVQGQTVNA